MGTHPIFESDFDCLTEWKAKDFDSHVMACKTFLDKNEIIPTNYDQQKAKDKFVNTYSHRLLVEHLNGTPLESRNESNQNNCDLMKEIENIRNEEKQNLKIKRFGLIQNFVSNEAPAIKEKFENFQQKLNEENQLKEEIEKLGKNWKNENIEAE